MKNLVNAFVFFYGVTTAILTIGTICVVKKNQETQDYCRLKYDEFLRNQRQNQNSKEAE